MAAIPPESSVPKFTTPEGLANAYGQEIVNCTFNADLNNRTRVRSRNQHFCESVSIRLNCSVSGSLSVGNTGTFGAPVTVMNYTFRPHQINAQGVFVLATGPLYFASTEAEEEREMMDAGLY